MYGESNAITPLLKYFPAVIVYTNIPLFFNDCVL
jgi:hypothetical protein